MRTQWTDTHLSLLISSALKFREDVVSWGQVMISRDSRGLDTEMSEKERRRNGGITISTAGTSEVSYFCIARTTICTVSVLYALPEI